MILLQLSGGAFGGMEIAQSIFGQFGVIFFIKSAIFLAFLYWSLSETIKVYSRKNIGRKAFNFNAVICGATIYLGWGFFLSLSAILMFFEYASANYSVKELAS